jgi:hypothetical protein
MPPRVGAGQLWLVLAAAAWLLSLLMQSAAPLLASAGAALPGGGASRAGAAQALLHARNGRRVVLLRMPRTGAGALCRLAADNGEAVLPGCEAAFGAKATRALRGGRPVEQCTALRTQPLGFFAVDEGVPNDPWLDAGAIYAAALREPRARLVSELLELQHRASQHLWVRFWAQEARRERASHAPLLFPPQGAGAWPSELVGLGFNASGAAPSLEALVLAATRPQGHRAPKAFRDNAAVRAFAGSAARASPHGRITETHLRVAMVRFHPLSQLLRSLADRLAPRPASFGVV